MGYQNKLLGAFGQTDHTRDFVTRPAATQASEYEQNENNGITMTNSHASPPPGTCHTEFLVENKCAYLDTEPTMNQNVFWELRGQTKSKSAKAMQTTKAKLHNIDTSTQAHGDHLLANSTSPS